MYYADRQNCFPITDMKESNGIRSNLLSETGKVGYICTGSGEDGGYRVLSGFSCVPASDEETISCTEDESIESGNLVDEAYALIFLKAMQAAIASDPTGATGGYIISKLIMFLFAFVFLYFFSELVIK